MKTTLNGPTSDLVSDLAVYDTDAFIWRLDKLTQSQQGEIPASLYMGGIKQMLSRRLYSFARATIDMLDIQPEKQADVIRQLNESLQSKDNDLPTKTDMIAAWQEIRDQIECARRSQQRDRFESAASPRYAAQRHSPTRHRHFRLHW